MHESLEPLGASVTNDSKTMTNHPDLPRTEGSLGHRTFMLKLGKSKASQDHILVFLPGLQP